MFNCKTHYLYLPITFLFFDFQSRHVDFHLILNPLVIVKPDLFFNALAHAYFVKISITVNIKLLLLLYLLRDDLSVKSADHVPSLFNGIILSLLNFCIYD